MFRATELFDADVISQDDFYWVIAKISEDTNCYYKCYGRDGEDLFKGLPVCIDREGYHLVSFVSLVAGNTPGRILLLGAAKVTGYDEIVMTAFEPLSGDPKLLDIGERTKVFNNLRKRLRNAIVVLAKRAGLDKVEAE